MIIMDRVVTSGLITWADWLNLTVLSRGIEDGVADRVHDLLVYIILTCDFTACEWKQRLETGILITLSLVA